MRLNDKELALFAAGPADRDGRMYHKHLNHGSSGTGREGESCFLSWLSYSWWVRLFLWLFIINFQNMPYLYYFLLLLHVILSLITVLISLNPVYFNYTDLSVSRIQREMVQTSRQSLVLLQSQRIWRGLCKRTIRNLSHRGLYCSDWRWSIFTLFILPDIHSWIGSKAYLLLLESKVCRWMGFHFVSV